MLKLLFFCGAATLFTFPALAVDRVTIALNNEPQAANAVRPHAEAIVRANSDLIVRRAKQQLASQALSTEAFFAQIEKLRNKVQQ